MGLWPNAGFTPDEEFFGLPHLPLPDASGSPPLVEAAEVIAHFDFNYSAAARRYQFPIIVRGVVNTVERVRNQDKTFRDVFVVAADDQTPLLPLRLNYMEQFGEEIDRLKTGDVIEACALLSPPMSFLLLGSPAFIATTLAVVGRAPPSPLGEAMIKWILRNSSMGPRSDFVAHASTIVRHETAHRQNFSLGIGADLMNSRQATVIGAQDGAMYLLELTAAQVAAMGLARNRMYPQNRGPSAARPADAEITSLVIDGGPLWKTDRPLSGAVTIHGAQSACAPPWSYSLRCVDYGAGSTFFAPLGSGPVGGHRREFSFTAKGAPRGLRLVLFQLVRVASGPGIIPTDRVASGPKPMMLEFR